MWLNGNSGIILLVRQYKLPINSICDKPLSLPLVSCIWLCCRSPHRWLSAKHPLIGDDQLECLAHVRRPICPHSNRDSLGRSCRDRQKETKSALSLESCQDFVDIISLNFCSVNHVTWVHSLVQWFPTKGFFCVPAGSDASSSIWKQVECFGRLFRRYNFENWVSALKVQFFLGGGGSMSPGPLLGRKVKQP